MYCKTADRQRQTDRQRRTDTQTHRYKSKVSVTDLCTREEVDKSQYLHPIPRIDYERFEPIANQVDEKLNCEYNCENDFHNFDVFFIS
jgi:hypothetical protein